MIQESIIELLFEHNCVILPGFGGFITNRLQSRVNELQHRVEPARKIVAFNKNLVQNDGLLADHMSRVNNISYDTAVEKINHFVIELQHEIKLKKHASLKAIGDFYLNSEGNIVFIPEADINFAKDTFGLFPIQVRKITRENSVAETAGSRSRPLPAPGKVKKGNRKWVYGAMLITLPLVLGFYTQQSGLLENAGININQVFNRKTEKVGGDKHSIAVTPETTPVIPQNQEQEVTPAPEVKTGTLPSVTDPATSTNAKSPETLIPPVNNEDKVSVHFHIIGGSFAYPENASKFLNDLKSRGYQAYIAGTNANGLIMISFAGFATEQEALVQLPLLRQKENGDAWLLNK